MNKELDKELEYNKFYLYFVYIYTFFMIIVAFKIVKYCADENLITKVIAKYEKNADDKNKKLVADEKLKSEFDKIYKDLNKNKLDSASLEIDNFKLVLSKIQNLKER